MSPLESEQVCAQTDPADLSTLQVTAEGRAGIVSQPGGTGVPAEEAGDWPELALDDGTAEAAGEGAVPEPALDDGAVEVVQLWNACVSVAQSVFSAASNDAQVAGAPSRQVSVRSKGSLQPPIWARALVHWLVQVSGVNSA